MLDPTKRFSTRVENYIKYRPGYPPEIIPLLESECGLTPDTLIADLGFGTGLLTELFLKHGNSVVGVEPNADMRAAGERILAKYSNFKSIEATAEATTLADNSIDMIVAGQAFHWFKPDRSRLEFQRILTSEGWVILIWNGFDASKSIISGDFQKIFICYSTDYCEAVRELSDNDISAFFSPSRFFKRAFANAQNFDFRSLVGRVLSMSYAPREDDERYDPMIEALGKMFERHQRNGQIEIQYETLVYYGQLK